VASGSPSSSSSSSQAMGSGGAQPQWQMTAHLEPGLAGNGRPRDPSADGKGLGGEYFEVSPSGSLGTVEKVEWSRDPSTDGKGFGEGTTTPLMHPGSPPLRGLAPPSPLYPLILPTTPIPSVHKACRSRHRGWAVPLHKRPFCVDVAALRSPLGACTWEGGGGELCFPNLRQTLLVARAARQRPEGAADGGQGRLQTGGPYN